MYDSSIKWIIFGWLYEGYRRVHVGYAFSTGYTKVHANEISFSGLSLELNASCWVNIDFNLFKIACCALAMSYCSQFVDPEIIHLPLFNFPQSHFNLKTEVRYALGLFDIRYGFWLFVPGVHGGRLKILLKSSRFILSTRWPWKNKNWSSKTRIGFGWS